MKKTFIFLVVVSLLLFFSGCTQNKQNNDKGYAQKTLTINCGKAYNPILQVIKFMDLLPPLLPDDVSVEWTALATGDASRDAMVAGYLDIAGISIAFSISAIENGLPLQIISGSAVVPVYVVSTKDNIRKLSDLNSNSKITIPGKGTFQHFAFASKCKELFNNSMLFDSQLVPIPSADVIGFMQTSNDYDAFVIAFPEISRIPNDMKYYMVEDLEQFCMEKGLSLYIVAAEKFVHNNPVLVMAFRKACEQAVDLLLNNTDEMAALLSDWYEVDADAIANCIRQCPPRLELSGYDDVAMLMYEMGMLSKPPRKFIELSNYNDIPKE